MLVKCLNCNDRGTVKIIDRYNIKKSRSEWCNCEKGKYLKTESKKDMYEY